MTFDPDAIVAEVRAIAARAKPPATIATLRQARSNVAEVANVARPAEPAQGKAVLSGPKREQGRIAMLAIRKSPFECRNVASVATPSAPDEAEIVERAGLTADRVPEVYLAEWARLNCRKPARVSDDEWRLADGRDEMRGNER